MTSLPVLPGSPGCWNRIGVWGDRSCPELAKFDHCHNCPVFASAGRQFLDAPSPPGYLEEWTQRLAAPVEEGAHDWQSVLIFRLGEEWLALPVRVLVEVTTPRPVHRVPLPGARGVLAGLVNIRGELHLCVHLDQLLGITPPEGAPPPTPAQARKARFLVVRRDADAWVFPVDEVDQVHRFPATQLAPVPATVGRSGAHLTRGLFACRERSIGYLDDARLFITLRAKVR